MDLHQYVRVLRRGWLLLVITTVAAVGVALAITAVMPPTYQAQSRIYVSMDNPADANDLGQGTIYSQEVVRSFVELTTSSSVLRPVISELGLDETPAELAERVEATSQTGTVILEINVSDEDPDQAATIASAVGESLNEVVQRLSPVAEDGGARISLAIVEGPEAPEEPTSPQPLINVGLGLVAGVALGIAILALREILDTRVRNDEDLDELTELPILGGVPKDKRIRDGVLVTQTDPGSPLAESFTTLRTNLRFLDLDRTSRSFVITSSIQGEGKSSVAVNLAISLRSSGQRVLLVDADLRRPELACLLGLEGAVGLTDLLADQVSLADVVQLWGPDDLAVLPAGTVPPNPNELLGSKAMRDLVENLHADYDIILFDAPPLLPVSDAGVLSAISSGVLLVVGVGTVHKPQVQKVIESLDMFEARLFGLVGTMLPTRGADADSYGRHISAYGYTADAAPR